MKMTLEEKQEISRKILLKAKEKLKEDFPSLIYPLNMLQLKEAKENIMFLCTDGESILYSPSEVVDTFNRDGYKELKTQIFHIVLHGLLGHLDMDGQYKDQKLLWAVMDLDVCKVINQLSSTCNLELDFLHYLYFGERCLKDMSGMDIYYQGRGDKNHRKKVLKSAKPLMSDDHKFWNMKSPENDGNGDKKEHGQNMWSAARRMLGPLATDVSGIAKSLSNDCAIENTYGTESGALQENVMAAEENENSYQKVLREFFRMKEDQRELPDAIDRMLYQYGLDLYGNIPLIEPPDSEERLKVSTICLAFDSSASCSGEIAQQFLRETWNVFRDLKQLSSMCEVYFFVCDTKIQREEHYDSLEELHESDWENADISGWGGTSFVPVFERIHSIQESENKEIDCLIYLTDSYGDCVEKEPDYPVYFVLPQNQMSQDGTLQYYNDLPEWIRFVCLGE